MSSNVRLALVAFIIAAIVLGGFFLLTPHAREVRPTALLQAEATSAPPPVMLTDSYKKGVHKLSGSVTAPDACAQVSADATLATSTEGGQQIVLDLSLPLTSGLCLDIPTETPFSTTITAPQGLPVDVRVNGVVATTT